MSTALLSMYDFVEYRNPSTVAGAGVDKQHPQQSAVPSHKSLFHQTSSSSSASSTSSSSSASSTSAHIHHKMTGGIRRTVSSATPSSGMGSMNTSARPNVPNGVTKSLSSNTQSVSRSQVNGTHITGKDPHKKLDRSFSEPAEKKNSAAAAAAAAASASSLGPSSRYKTELCRSFAEVGSCKYGDKCQFAHGEEELRIISRHPKFKTEKCKSFHSTGFCPYGPRCHFIHNDESGESVSKKQQQNSILNNETSAPAVPSSPSAIVGAPVQRMFEPVIGSGATIVRSSQQHQQSSVVNHHVPATAVHSFPATSPPAVLNNANLVRPKALSLGSYSLGSSGEISSPSSQSGSPTSLNSFSFSTEDSNGLFGLGTGFCLNGASSRHQHYPLSATVTNAFAPTSAGHMHNHNNQAAFSFSPDSAFVSFNGPNSGSNSNSGSSLSFGSSGSQKCTFGGSQPTLASARFSPEPSANQQLANDQDHFSAILSLLGGNDQHSAPLDLMYRPMSPGLGMNPGGLPYPMSPESPVDSVASEIEALRLGETSMALPLGHHQQLQHNPARHHQQHQHLHLGFAPISPSYSSSSLSQSSSSSPPIGPSNFLSELENFVSDFGAVGGVNSHNHINSGNSSSSNSNSHLSRLSVFAKFGNGCNGQLTSAHQ